MNKDKGLQLRLEEKANELSVAQRSRSVLRSLPYLDSVIKEKLWLTYSVITEEGKKTQTIH